MKKFLLFFSAFSFLLASKAQAQYHWQMERQFMELDTLVLFNAISCSGENCIGSGTLIPPNRLVSPTLALIWQSTDGGKTWQITKEGTVNNGFGQLGQFSPLEHVQQIDAQNAAAGGDSGLFLRTFDGGKNWQRMDLKNKTNISSIHFSDSLNGIIGTNGLGSPKITTDGGRHWIDGPFDTLNITACHSSGNGKFQCFNSMFDNLYSTTDSWKHYFVSHLPNPLENVFINCFFVGGDTIFISGYNRYTNTAILWRGYPLESFFNWEEINFPFLQQPLTSTEHGIDAISVFYHDTVLAHQYNGNVGIDTIFRSTDRGTTWQTDSLMLDTALNLYKCAGLTWAKEGYTYVPIGLFDHYAGTWAMTVARGVIPLKAHVNSNEYIRFNTFTYPNPASTELNIITPMPLSKIVLFDMLGREVLDGFTSPEGKITLDISQLPKGVYTIRLNNSGSSITIGKVVAIGK